MQLPDPLLYRRVMGDAWDRLAPAVQSLHGGSGQKRFAGAFNVKRSHSALLNLLMKPMALPDAGSAVPLTLVISATGKGETWHRTFAGKPFISEQVAGHSRRIRESVASGYLWFRPAEDAGSLVFEEVAFAARLGPLTIPVPAWLAPRLTAKEDAVAGKPGVHATVRVTHPWFGLLIEYEGYVEPENA